MYSSSRIRSSGAALFLLGAAVLCQGATLLDELNRARTDPRSFARQLERRRPLYRGTLLRLPGRTPIRTREGVRALDEAIRVLDRTAPLPRLGHSEALESAAEAHARDIGQRGAVSHTGADGSRPHQRIRKRLAELRTTGEAISFGPAEPLDVLIDLLVDDGVRDRGHRRLLLSREFDLAGAACAPHREYRTVCVIDLGSFR